MSVEEIRQQQLIQLKEILANWFSRDELEDLSFDLGVDYSALGGSTKEGNIRYLIMELSRRGRLPKLIETCNQKRPEIEWGIFNQISQVSSPAALPEPSKNDPIINNSGRDNRLLLAVLAALVLSILTIAGAATFFLTRTINPRPTAQPPIIQVPTQGTPMIQQEVITQLTPTDIVITAGSSENPADPVSTQLPIVETATLPFAINQTEPPFTVRITDTYRGNPLKEANIRNGPGLEYEIVAKREPNIEIVVWAYAYNSAGIPWYLIDIGEGQLGWISGVLVDIGPIPFKNFPIAATVPPTESPQATPEA